MRFYEFCPQDDGRWVSTLQATPRELQVMLDALSGGYADRADGEATGDSINRMREQCRIMLVARDEGML